MNHFIEIIATVLFIIAVIHTFLCSRFMHWAHRYPQGSVRYNLLHVLGEVEIVFGVWAAVLILIMQLVIGVDGSIAYLEGLNFTEPMFVFVIMVIAGTKPIVEIARYLILKVAHIIPIKNAYSRYLTCLILGPILGSFITEPAAMTVTAIILSDLYFQQKASDKFKYLSLAILFVNISIGGVLTHFAAPPVLMVASTWSWDTPFMMLHFGWKAVVAVFINTILGTLILRKELSKLSCSPEDEDSTERALAAHPILVIIHLAFLVLTVLNAHHPILFIGLFLFFIGLTQITRRLQEPLKIREGLLVGYFLGGLVVLGGLQAWWLNPLIQVLNDGTLFLGATFLTAITDNAALTYLGSQIANAPDDFKYFLVAGAVAGGGLTVIANAPNPAGYAILGKYFGDSGIKPLNLFLYALVPTLIACSCFWFLPSL